MRQKEIELWLLNKFKIKKKDINKNIFEVTNLDSFQILVVVLEVEKVFKLKNFQRILSNKIFQKIDILVKKISKNLDKNA